MEAAVVAIICPWAASLASAYPVIPACHKQWWSGVFSTPKAMVLC